MAYVSFVASMVYDPSSQRVDGCPRAKEKIGSHKSEMFAQQMVKDCLSTVSRHEKELKSSTHTRTILA